MYDLVRNGLFIQTKSATVSILPNKYFTLCVQFMVNVFKQEKEITVLRNLDNTLYFT